MKNSILAFIPARGGSKSIPLKNIKLLADKPLLCYVIESALDCDLIDEVVVSTDSDLIEETINRHFQERRLRVYRRSHDTSTDTATTESAMLEFARDCFFTHMILIQATSPLLSSDDLSGGLKKYLSSGAGGMVSVVRQKRFIWMEENFLGQPLNYDFRKRPRRQDFEGFYVENGAFYITSRDNLLNTGCRVSTPIVLWEMSEDTYLELDELRDWVLMEELIKTRNKQFSTGLNMGKSTDQIKLFLTDVDGVLTDAGMYYSESGDELKKFNTKDGKGLEILRNHGIRTGIITSEDTKIVAKRAEKLKVDFVYQGSKDKVSVLAQILLLTDLKTSEVAYIGDDLNDLEIITKVGLSFAPSDAVSQIKNIVDVILESKGGYGCVREAVDYILRH